jgi:hypothetical protein
MMMPKQNPVRLAPPMARAAPCEAEVGGPGGQDARDAEADARRENGQVAGPQQALAFGAVASALTVASWLSVVVVDGQSHDLPMPGPT